MNSSRLAAALGPLAGLAVLLLAAFWIYYPGITGPNLLDDYSSLGSLDHLAESPEQLWDYVFGDGSGPLGRSVSMLTFVLETLFTDGEIATSKLLNIFLHLLTGTLVFWFLALLLSAIKAPRYLSAAIVFAGVWLLAPLQVSTVLYLVQRMAMLAAMFSLLSLIFYLHWRRGLSAGRPRYHWLCLSLLALIAGIFAKENAVVGVPLILLTEACWLQCRDNAGQRIIWLQRFTYSLIGLGFISISAILVVYWDSIEARYSFREFSLYERLLTEARILWDYLAQFFLPQVDRLGVYHDDFPLSRSLQDPGALLAVSGWLAVLVTAVLLLCWPFGRRLAYGPLFFLAAHSLESTVWPLELYFEHRNYLPAVGLVIFPLAIYAWLATRWKEVGAPLLVWMSIVLLYFSALTSSQVQIWSSEVLLAMQTVNGHPESARANKEYATQLAQIGARDEALEYSTRAYFSALKYAAASDEHEGDYVLRNVALACIAKQPLQPHEYRQLGRFEPGRPLGVTATLNVVTQLRHSDSCPDFDWQGFQDHLAALYLESFDTSLASANMFTALAMLANADARWDDAYEYVRRSLARAPGRTKELLMQLHFTTALGREKEAQNLIAELQARQDAGKLNRGEQDTLALYLGG